MKKIKKQQGLVRGYSTFGFFITLVAVLFCLITVARVTPSVIDYFEAKQSISKAVREGSDPGEIRDIYAKQAQVNNISEPASDDLNIERDGEKYRVNFQYEKKFKLFGPVYLTIKYEGDAHS